MRIRIYTLKATAPARVSAKCKIIIVKHARALRRVLCNFRVILFTRKGLGICGRRVQWRVIFFGITRHTILDAFSVIFAACMVTFATETVMQLCHGKRRCSVVANSTTFGDPCRPDSRTYLKVVYTCGESGEIFLFPLSFIHQRNR